MTYVEEDDPRYPRTQFSRMAKASELAMAARRSPSERAGLPTPAEQAVQARLDAELEQAVQATAAAHDGVRLALVAENREREKAGAYVPGSDTPAVVDARRVLSLAMDYEGHVRVRGNDERMAIGQAMQRRRIQAEQRSA